MEKNQKKVEKAIQNDKPIPVTKTVDVQSTVKPESGAGITFKKKKNFKVIDFSKLPDAFLQWLNIQTILQMKWSRFPGRILRKL